MRRAAVFILLSVAVLLLLAGCSGKQSISAAEPNLTEATARETSESIITDGANELPFQTEDPTPEEENEKVLTMRIDDTAVAVEWENNASVSALMELCAERPLVIEMSMYGGFEQVGPIGSRLPSNDVQTQTSAGDIVLYSSSRIVVFYGSNSWAYTRLGRITDKSAADLAKLLGNGDVTVTLSMEG